MKSIRIEIRNGILVFLLLGGYFLIIDAVGLADQFYLRLFNIFLVGYGANLTIQSRLRDGKFGYFGNLIAGFFTALIGTSLSVIGLFLYIEFIQEPDYLYSLADSLFITATPNNLLQYCIGLVIEGVGSSVVISYGLMQRWKNVTQPSHLTEGIF
jgi:hypothetical protein